MNIQKSLKDAVDIALLKEPVMNKIALDKGALIPALMIVGAAGLICALGAYVFPTHVGFITYRPSMAFVLEQAVITFALGVAFLYLTGYLAERFFGSKVNMQAFVAVMGHANIVSVIGFISSLSAISGIWGLVILWNFLTKVAKMEPKNVIILMVIDVVIVIFGASAYAGSMMMGI
ncbi:MAG: YIP1 family protein [Candidatus Gracilibacteria bacterium]|jgi:hypothetical protein